MNENKKQIINNKWIVSKRGNKNNVDPQKPYAWIVEKERQSTGEIEDVATIFLTNNECPFKCLMCDLWKNTTNKPVPVGAIPDQIKWALSQMPLVKHLKLYNSGNFFDGKAIPEEDFEKIADLIKDFETVVVESHPKFINDKCLQFNHLIKSKLEVAIGLETVNPEVLFKLNKQMNLNDFKKAVDFLTENRIFSRAFILLRPPFLTEEEGIYWAQKSIDFAFETGIECCAIIPVRGGNGAMELLRESEDFKPPTISSLETVLEYGIALNAGRVFADVWDLGLFSECDNCIESRTERLVEMNLNQKTVSKIHCSCN